jgi:hypothetical protein
MSQKSLRHSERSMNCTKSAKRINSIVVLKGDDYTLRIRSQARDTTEERMKPKSTNTPDGQLRDRIRDYFGFRKFRPGQAEAVNSALEGRDTLVVMPTGSGKSLCFQLTAIALEGITVVVSPLISLNVPSPRQRIQHSINRHTALECNRLRGVTGSFWQRESYDHWIRDVEELERIIRYAEANPVKAGLVEAPEDWPFSSAHDRKLFGLEFGEPLVRRRRE